MTAPESRDGGTPVGRNGHEAVVSRPGAAGRTEAPGRRTVLLVQPMSPVEARVFDRWLASASAGEPRPDVVRLTGDWRGGGNAALVAPHLDRADDPVLVPVGVVWGKIAGPRRASPWRDLLLVGNPHRPRLAAQAWLARRDDGGCQVVLGAGASVSELRGRFAATVGPQLGEPDAFAAFVLRQATLAVERSVTRLLGPPYKIPRLVRDEVAASARFREVLEKVAARIGRPVEDVLAEGRRDLEEMVTGWSRLLVDLQAQFGRYIYRQGYDADIEYDPGEVERVRAAVSSHPTVMLMSHRSHLDGLVLPVAQLDNDLPRTHLVGGANMAVWPLGALMRRAGVVYIRREFRGDAVYKAVLREYIGYLVEKRLHLQWAIEGTRSRTGKMEPPRLGLLAYVVGALREGRAEDVMLAPVFIGYDQLHEVGEYAAYASGVEKKAENLRYVVDYIRAQREHYGKIYIRFAEPISVRDFLARVSADGQDPNELNKLAFEAAWRMNQVAPVTGAALVCAVLLDAGGVALTLPEIRAGLGELTEFAGDRGYPLTVSARSLATDEGLLAMLEALTRHRVIDHYPDGDEAVWRVGRDRHLNAAFYRNSALHVFLDLAIAVLALEGVGQRAAGDAGDPADAFWAAALDLRDLLKFDFYFPEKEQFVERLAAELDRQVPDWRARLAAGPDGARAVLAGLGPLSAPGMLRSFVEAYGVVADVLCGMGAEVDGKELRRRCLAVGRQYRLQGRVHSPDAVSTMLFRTGVELATNQGLLEPGPDLAARRAAFAERIRDALRGIDAVAAAARPGARTAAGG
ncbi:glycerol-3-phosphate 1-O-acyltransferase [Trujillonella humicola]|uniref:glycerol-3-phosphate 1-O-acyltransferase n=1 Tax=Trujillonella humicola TaxID=3383699 RepID=UPI0039059E83